MRLAIPAALAALVALAIFGFSGGRVTAQSPALLAIESNITYDVKVTSDAVKVSWDTTVTDNDPETTFSRGQGFYYSGVRLPVLVGATNVSATDGSGKSLDVDLEDVEGAIVQSASITFATGLFFGQSYDIHLTYDLLDTRSQAILVSPHYAYIPAVAAGDPATVTITTPSGDPWSVTLEPQDCAQTDVTFTCSGSSDPYLAAIAEVSQPGRTATTTFTVPLADKDVAVSLTAFEGEEATAVHQQSLITAALPAIEETFGFDYTGPAALNVSQGGQQSVLGYEGLTSCDADSCDVVISPIANDYTVIHELAHLWTPVFSKRWLQEGFAQLIAETVGPQLQPGTVNGDPPQRPPSSVQLQLDEWGPTTTLIAADPDKLATEDAGYDYSLRFLQTLRDQFGMQALEAVNRNIATSGQTADSQQFMDLMEEATGRPMDNLFLVWVFPDSYRQVIEDRREAIDRLDSLQTELSAQGLPGDILTPIQTDIDQWAFDQALARLDDAETGLATYAELLPQLQDLETQAADAGLELPDTIAAALNEFDFEKARNDLSTAREAVTAYVAAGDKVSENRSLWTRFGLLGSNPDGSLTDAAESFAGADFDTSREQSRHAQQLVEDASTVAFRRLLLLAGFLSVLALAVGIAVAVGHFRERGLAEP